MAALPAGVGLRAPRLSAPVSIALELQSKEQSLTKCWAPCSMRCSGQIRHLKNALDVGKALSIYVDLFIERERER